jgi:Tryptophan-rich Synechocystis species C-terminal domain/Lipase (class 3)/Calx-beta domain/The GLUG motif
MSTVINSLADLENINNNLSGNYVLGADIDASGTTFIPIGDLQHPFTGTFDGQGHTINGLTITLPVALPPIPTSAPLNAVGLFAALAGQISNVGLVNETVSGTGEVGGLVGVNQGSISHSYVVGTIVGGTISDIGGLAGTNGGIFGGNGTIIQSSFTGSVTGYGNIGALFGINRSGSTIDQSFATGSVSGTSSTGYIGGLGSINNGIISNSYATVSVSLDGLKTFDSAAGGLVAYNSGNISDSYATGSIVDNSDNSALLFDDNVGSLVGNNFGSFTNSYATGTVSGTAKIFSQGLVGSPTGTLTNTLSLASAQLQAGLPTGFESTIWSTKPLVNQGYPYLQWQATYSISPSLAPVNENQGTLTFTITRSDNSRSQTVYVSTVQDQGNYNAASGATSTNYYYGGLVNVPYTFAAGQSSIQVPISIFDHGLTSGSEKFAFEAQDALGNEVASTTFTIVNNDTASTTFSISPSPAVVNENASKLTFTLTRSDNSQQQTVSVSTVPDQGYYNAASGTAGTNYYYGGLAGVSYSFAPGQSSIPIQITINDNGLTFGSEKFSLDVQSTSGANLASTTFTILNSDQAPAVAQPPPSHTPPTVTGPSALSVSLNDSLNFKSTINSNDSDGQIEFYQFQETSGNGFFSLGGVNEGASVKVSPSQLPSVGFNAGSNVGIDKIQVTAVDNFGATSVPLNINVSVSAQSGPAPPPDPGALADLSLDVYNVPPKGAGEYSVAPYDTLGDKVYFNPDGFFASAYGSSDGSQIVVAIQGSDLQDINSWYADGSWVESSVTGTLQEYFDDAVQFLLDVKAAHPDATIQLTGHSLGGALALLLGEASNLQATGFDAPGAQDFLGALLGGLSSSLAAQLLELQQANSTPQTLDNFRLYADPVSTVGTPIGTTITLQNPSPDPADLPPLDNHNLSWLDVQVKGFLAGLVPQVPEGGDEPNQWNSIVAGVIGLTESFIGVPANSLQPLWFDPPGSSDFIYTEDSSSPPITSVELPDLPGVQSYAIRYKTGVSWSVFQQVGPEQWQAPGLGVDGVEFIPLDPTGHSVSVTDAVMFGLVFGATGTVNATLNSSALNALFGGPGNDTLIAGPNELIDGGPGANTVVYDGSRSQYEITALRNDIFQIVDLRPGSPDGTDTISNVENLQFSDTTLAVMEIESDGATILLDVGSNFFFYPVGGSSGPELKYNGAAVVAGQFGGAWTPIGAEATAGGYEVAWENVGADQFTVWNTDSNGNYLGNAIGVVSGTDPSLEALEPSFQQDLNGDGMIGPPPPIVIESFGSTELVEVGTSYFLYPVAGSSGPELKLSGAAVVAGQFGAAWAPIGAEKTASGYEVAWENVGANQFTVWNTDSNGNYLANAIGVVSGTDPSLEALESSFQQDLNGDGTVGFNYPAIETFGSTELAKIGNNYFVYQFGGSSAPELKLSGAAVVAGQFGAAWAPIGAEATASGYEVAWENVGANQFTVWNTDNNGNYLANAIGVVSGTDPSLEALEPSFHQDLNGDGVIGFDPPPIESFGATELVEIGSNYFFYPVGGSSGVELKLSGAAVAAGQFGAAWAPIGAEKTASGYEVAWENVGANQFTVWNTDSSGNYLANAIGVVSGTDPSLEALEPSFHQDLNGDGVIGFNPPPIESFGATELVEIGSNFFFYPVGGSSGVELKLSGAAVVAGQFGAAWAPIGAEATASGYEVAWENVGANQFTVWNTDSNGNYVGNAIGIVSGTDRSLEALEPSFHQDLNGDGIIGIPPGSSSSTQSSAINQTIADGGSLEVNGPSTNVITFAGSTGTLIFDQSTEFTGQISGLTGQDQIDLRDIGFGANTTLLYSENAGNTGGLLAVSDGTHTANLSLSGQYTTANFTMLSDSAGGTLLYDPPVVRSDAQPPAAAIRAGAGDPAPLSLYAAPMANGVARLAPGGTQIGALASPLAGLGMAVATQPLQHLGA